MLPNVGSINPAIFMFHDQNNSLYLVKIQYWESVLEVTNEYHISLAFQYFTWSSNRTASYFGKKKGQCTENWYTT